jgi:hypothetical protein
MITIPKYFINSDYLHLNGDLKYYKIHELQNHYVQHGHAENRKYNKNIGINYPFKLHLTNIQQLGYQHFFDFVIEYKLNIITDQIIDSNIKNQFIEKNINQKSLYTNDKLNIEYIINNTITSNIEHIKNEIYSERDLAKKFKYEELYTLLWDTIQKIENNCITQNTMPNLNEIFQINNKYLFFYYFFKWHTSHILDYNFKIKNSNNNSKTAVIVETRHHILLLDVINNIMLNLGNDWNLHIFCGFDNYNYVKNKFPHVKITLLPFYNMSVDIYDFVFLNNFFWESIQSEDILIFQTDTYLINDPINSFINNYVYLGAPHTNIHGGVSYLTPHKFGLNGGFSFRKKSAMIHALNNIKTIDINNYRKMHNCLPLCKTPINNIDINYEFLFKHFEISNKENSQNIIDNNNYSDVDFINNSSDEYIIKNNFNTDLIYEDVFFSHAIEMLNFPKPNSFNAKKFIIQEDINGFLTDIKGVHGWDKPYINLNYHKKTLKKYAIKIIKKINSKESLFNFIARENFDIYDFVSNNSLINKKIHYKTFFNSKLQGLENNEYILVICHNMGGGTEKYVRDLITINNNYVKQNNINKKLHYDIIRILDSNYQSTNILFNEIPIKLIKSTKNIFTGKKYNTIHIHYLNEPAFILYNYILEIISQINPPNLYITLHDYHFIINDKTNEYHLTTYNTNKNFLDELKTKQSNVIPFMLLRNLLNKANIVFTGSSTLKIVFNYIFELNNNLIKVAKHPESIYFTPIPKNLIGRKNLNIGVIGSISISKGAHMIQDMSLYFQTQKLPWKIFHFGMGFSKNVRKQSNIISIGTYPSEKYLKKLLIDNDINMLWFPAYRHESYCYTLTLAMQSELPIIAYDSGTFKERLNFYNFPYKIHSCEYICEKLFEDIKNFYAELNKNTHVNQKINNEFNYDNVNYEILYV